MTSNLDKFTADLERLLEEGETLLLALLDENRSEVPKGDLAKLEEKLKGRQVPSFRFVYEGWYSEALEVVRQALPNRLKDFQDLYKREKSAKLLPANYSISDYMAGLNIFGFKPVPATVTRFNQQRMILDSAKRVFSSSLFSIRQVVQADFFDSELDGASELVKHRFCRAAGAIAGVVLEKHLLQVCSDHKLSIAKQHPTISDLNEALKSNNVIEIPQWRFIQHLCDVRNLCDHHRGQEPSPDQVGDLIGGVAKIIKSIL